MYSRNEQPFEKWRVSRERARGARVNSLKQEHTILPAYDRTAWPWCTIVAKHAAASAGVGVVEMVCGSSRAGAGLFGNRRWFWYPATLQQRVVLRGVRIVDKLAG